MTALERLILVLSLGSACAVVCSTSHAYCPNLCELTVRPVVAHPPLTCGTVSDTFPEGCECGLSFDVKNELGCSSTIEAVGFEFTNCYPSNSPGPCSILEAGISGTVRDTFTTTGKFRTSVVVRDSGGDHRLEAVANVTDFPDQYCYGSLARHSAHSGNGWFGSGLLVLLLAWARRQRL